MAMLQPAATGINSSEVKLHNISAILLNLLHNDNVSRVSLAQLLGVSTATITNLVSELVEQGLIVEEGFIRNNGQASVGRPQKALSLVPNSRYAIGIHIDVGRVYVTITNIRGEIIQQSTFEHQLNTAWHQVMNRVVEMVESLISQANIDRREIVGVGVAASGLIDPATGVNVIAPNLNWHDVPIRDYLHSKLNMLIQIENNVRAMALGEALVGDTYNVNVMAFIYARIGVGAGLVINGQIYRGAGAGAGEIGHIVIMVEKNGKHQTHSLESLFSEPAILQGAEQLLLDHPEGILAKKIDLQGLSLETVLDAVEAGDQPTIDLLHERSTYFGIALANLINLFNPELIVLGGIFTRERNLILPIIEKTLKHHSFANLSDNIRLQVTDFGQYAGMIGAAAVALDTFFYRPVGQLQPS